MVESNHILYFWWGVGIVGETLKLDIYTHLDGDSHQFHNWVVSSTQCFERYNTKK